MDLNKPIFILAQGPSIKHLEEWIEEYKHLDVLYGSFNRFSTVEPIINKIDKYFNIIYSVNSLRILEEKEAIRKYLSLGEDRQFVLTPSQLLHSKTQKYIHPELNFLFEKHQTNILYKKTTKDNGSLVHMIVTLILLGHKKFFLFGVDGQEKWNIISKHYKQEYYHNSTERVVNSGGSLVDDTRKLNEGFDQYTKNIDMKNVEIFNCNPDSLVKCFPIIGYDEVIKTYESLSI